MPFELTPDGQTWPRGLNADIGGQSGNIYLAVGNLGPQARVDAIFGRPFLQRFLTVYDANNGSIGVANTPYTYSTINNQ
jgi:cathepsin E